ncbi:MAG: hypothetical protein ACUZ77_06455 [Candidatus Brocadiales bacterium]
MMKKTFLRSLCVGILVAACVIGISLESANAIPPFARKYKTNCQTCHTAFPKLNPFGMAFRANGYRFPGGDDMFIKDDPISLGASANKRMFPNAMWPSDLPYLPPIGITMFSNLFIGEDNETTTEFDGIEEIGILAGGTLGESFSFFLDYRLFLWGDSHGWLDRAFITWTPIWINEKLGELATKLFNINEIEDPAGIFNARIGQFEIRATPMFGGHRNLITLKGTPSAVSYPVLPIGNFWGFFPNQKGIEFFGGINGPRGKGGFEWAAGVVNGEQSMKQMMFGGSVDSRSPTRNLGRFDDNDFKDYYGRLSYKIGGLGVMGGGEVETSDIALENWQDGERIFGNVHTSAKIGVFYYRGKSDFTKPGASFLANTTGNDENGLNQNHFTRYGVDLDWIIGSFNIVGSAVVYWDNMDNPVAFDEHIDTLGPGGTNSLDGLDDKFKTVIYTAEIDYVIYPWLMPAVRYEWIQPDYSFTGASPFSNADEGLLVTTKRWERLSLDVAILAAANIKFVAGYQVSIGEPPPRGSHFRDFFRLGVNIGF